MSIFNLHHDYKREVLLDNDVDSSPFKQFSHWFEEALKADIPEANAMAVSTVNHLGVPSVRIVLLKEFDERGFVFYTNYNSRKGCDLAHNSYISLLFFWQMLERQIRIEGEAYKTDATQSDAYYHARPIGSRLAAWSSDQSSVTTRGELDTRFAAFQRHFDGKSPPRPPFWGGYRVNPNSFEFWQGRISRLHDRILYQRNGQHNWTIKRLAP